MTLIITAVAGSLGAVCRYLMTGYVQRRTRSGLPLGTATVNLIGALAVGIVGGAGDLHQVGPLAIAGFMGGFTTFSTWMIESVRLGLGPEQRFRAAINVAAMLVGGVALAAAGFMLTN